MCGNDGLDGAVIVELHLVDADFAVCARLVLQVVLVDAVVHHVPLVLAWYLEYGVVRRAIYFLFGTLNQYHGLLGHLNGAERRLGRSVCHVVVGRAGVVHAPEEIICAFAVEYVRCLAESIIFQWCRLEAS